MKTSIRLLSCLGVVLCAAATQAGLYNPSEPIGAQLPQLRMTSPDNFPAAYEHFKDFALEPLRTIGMQKVLQDNPLRLRYRLVTESADAFKARGWSFQQQLSLSEYLIRRGDEASRLLENLREGKHRFLALANLGTAAQLKGELQKASTYLEQAASAWPEDWQTLDAELRTFFAEMRWGKQEFDWYRKAEGYHRKLVQLRSQEKLPPDTENVDAIFGDAFVFDEKNPFTPGKLPSGKVGRLPADALPITQQLLVWLPNDQRLLWLLGEVYNARGEYKTAKSILDDLSTFKVSFRPYRPQLLLEHREVLRKYTPPQPEVTTTKDKKDDDKTKDASFDWRSLTVGFGAGIVFAFFGYWQIREIVRRRRPTAKVGR